jgi:hypothetical protein
MTSTGRSLAASAWSGSVAWNALTVMSEPGAPLPPGGWAV